MITRILIVVAAAVLSAGSVQALQEVPEAVAGVFRNNCVRCHNSRFANAGLNLEPGAAHAGTVRRKSTQKPEYLLVNPGDPSSSYLVMKISADARIGGSAMPPGEKLPEEAAKIIIGWVSALPPDTPGGETEPERGGAFPGWSIGNLPTAEVLEKGSLLFAISHRFAPEIGEGYDELFGMDGPAVMMLSLDVPVTDNFMIGAGRSNEQDNLELKGRYRLLRERENGPPLSLAVQAVVNLKTQVSGRDNEAAYTLQIPGTMRVLERVSLAVAPGITFNPNPFRGGEDPLVSLGVGGRILIGGGFAVFGETTPVLSGFPGTPGPYGRYDSVRRFDSWSFGLEGSMSVHVFQVFLTNSQGIAADSYLTGGDLDITEGEMRIGFTIFSVI